jgi:hypothetical protein
VRSIRVWTGAAGAPAAFQRRLAWIAFLTNRRRARKHAASGATGGLIFNDNVVIENIGLFPSVRRVMVRAKASNSFANLQQDVKCRTKGWALTRPRRNTRAYWPGWTRSPR